MRSCGAMAAGGCAPRGDGRGGGSMSERSIWYVGMRDHRSRVFVVSLALHRGVRPIS